MTNADVPFAQGAIIQDISVALKGPNEDEVFAKDFNLH